MAQHHPQFVVQIRSLVGMMDQAIRLPTGILHLIGPQLFRVVWSFYWVGESRLGAGDPNVVQFRNSERG